MAKVTGIGGVFFLAQGDSQALSAWYAQHLGVNLEDWGGAIMNWSHDSLPDGGMTVWNVAATDSDWFQPSNARFMINYRVEDLHALVATLKAEGCNVMEKIDDSEFGKFAWVIDPEGNKVELWQPPEGQ